MTNYVLRQVPAAKHTEKAGATDPATEKQPEEDTRARRRAPEAE